MSPEIINGFFALGGASIGVIGAYIVAKSTKKTFRLSIHKSPLAKLLDVDDLVKSDVQINYKNKPITGLYAGEFSIHNTGTQSIENIQLEIIASEDSPIIDFEISTTSFTVDKSLKHSTNSPTSLNVTIPFLNPKDRISYSYTVAGDGDRPEIIARQKDVDITIRDEITSWIPDIYAEAMFAKLAKDPLSRLVLSFIIPEFKLYLESKKKI